MSLCPIKHHVMMLCGGMEKKLSCVLRYTSVPGINTPIEGGLLILNMKCFITGATNFPKI